jgi:hypothetical protein
MTSRAPAQSAAATSYKCATRLMNGSRAKGTTKMKNLE